jgi:4-aminobutyrate aminotransferase / (S)-3-amino-2-methylpropionate transaminase
MSDTPAVERPFFADEPQRPAVLTSIPGPETRKILEDLDKVFDTRSAYMLANYEKSLGN